MLTTATQPPTARQRSDLATTNESSTSQAGQGFPSSVDIWPWSLLPKSYFLPRVASAAAVGALLAIPASIAHASPDIAALTSLQEGAFFPGLVGDSPLREGFVSAFLLIFFSEIGDKTFFIAVLLALRRPKSLVFAGTFGALAVMTVISVALGRFLHELDEYVPTFGIPLDDALAVLLLVFFGVQTLLNASTADEDAEEERDEAQEAVDELDKSFGAATLGLLASTFALVFAAEWGDKSFLATIALAAASNPTGVVLGAVAGHGAATVIAVLGGSFLGNYLSERVVQYLGGSLFLVFAAATMYDIVTGAH
jgi:putative Ca2+/H+ antiporter (TMEM165/GDT1 family)